MKIFPKSKFLFAFGFVLFLAFLFLPAFSHAQTFTSEDISTDTTWSLSNSPYIIDGGILISPGVTLNIESGTVVKFTYGSSLGVFGSINISGDASDQVVFTSYYDDGYGGDTDYEDDPDEDIEAFSGDWDGVYFLPGSNILSDVDLLLRYASIGILAYQAELEVKDLYIEKNIDGIEINQSTAKMDNISFSLVEHYSMIIQSDSNIDAQSLSIEGSEFPLVIYGDSNINIDNIEITNAGNTAISIFNNSTLEAKNINIQNSRGDGLEIFNESNVVSDSLVVVNTSGDEAVVIFNNSFLLAKDVRIEGGEYGLIFFNGAVVNLSNGEISNFLESGVEDYGSDDLYEDNQILLEFVEVKNNSKGFVIYSSESTYVLNKCSIYNNTNIGTQAFLDANLDFKKVWWGSVSGPYNEFLNSEGGGNPVLGDIDFIPFLTAKPSQNIPLIIIPGITGSYLYKDYDDHSEIWPNVNKLVLNINKDSFLDDLSLNRDANGNLNFPMIVGDIVRNAKFENNLKDYESHIFDYFIDYFLDNGYEEDADLFVFPYDWRFSNIKTAELLDEKINEVLEATGVDKVDIASHSMGGIVAKTYIKNFGGEKINHLVFMGTPHLGAPKGAKALVYGDNMGLEIAKTFNILSPYRIKIISQNMPSVYELIPSKKYFSDVGGYLNIIGQGMLNYDKSKSFLFSKNLNQSLYNNANTLHDEIDDIDFGDINIGNIISCGIGTFGHIIIRPEKRMGPFVLEEDFDIGFTSGDTTVPTGSAGATNIGQKYFVDKISHGTMPSSGDVPELAYKIIKNEDTSSFSTNEDICTPVEGDVLSKHSPIDLHVYDEYGNHAGPDENGNIENNIDGVVYEILEDKAFVFLPKGRIYRIEGMATNSGEFDLALESVYGDDTLNTRYWQDININENSQIEIFVNSGNYGELMLDSDGDDTFETEVAGFADLGHESYLDYSYNKFINEHTEENKSPSFGFKKPDVDVAQPQESIFENTSQDQILLSKNLLMPVFENLDSKDGQKSLSIMQSVKEGIDNQQGVLQNNNLVAQAGRVNIPTKLPFVVSSVSILCLITAIVKKYYFTLK